MKERKAMTINRVANGYVVMSHDPDNSGRIIGATIHQELEDAIKTISVYMSE